MNSWQVWDVVPVAECKRRTGKAPLKGRWVDVNKGDMRRPIVRCRWVAKEFNNYKLGDGESFDFSEFKDAHKFYHESKPIGRMLAKAKAILINSVKNPLSKVIILTARANFDDRDKFLSTFRKYGFDIDRVRVERAGELVGNEIPAIKKVVIVRKYLQSNQYGKVRLFDDSMSNLREFLKLRTEFRNIKFEAFFANPDGSVKVIK